LIFAALVFTANAQTTTDTQTITIPRTPSYTPSIGTQMFNANNLVVFRHVGYTSGIAAAVDMVEMTITGTIIRVIPISNSGGPGKRITVQGGTGTQADSHASLTADGYYIMLAGYDVPDLGLITGVNRIVAKIDYSGSVSYGLGINYYTGTSGFRGVSSLPLVGPIEYFPPLADPSMGRCMSCPLPFPAGEVSQEEVGVPHCPFQLSQSC
jgi:hypothetical protein